MKSLSQHITESFSETNETILDGTTGRKTSNSYTTNGRKESEEGVTESTEDVKENEEDDYSKDNAVGSKKKTPSED